MTSPTWLTEIEGRVKAADGAPWRYEKIGQTVWGHSPGGCSKTLSDYMVANVRGWGHLQYMGDTRGDEKAAAMQDANGELIAHAPADLTRLIAEYRKMREALEPFAKTAQRWESHLPDNVHIYTVRARVNDEDEFTLADLRRARTALTQDDER